MVLFNSMRSSAFDLLNQRKKSNTSTVESRNAHANGCTDAGKAHTGNDKRLYGEKQQGYDYENGNDDESG